MGSACGISSGCCSKTEVPQKISSPSFKPFQKSNEFTKLGNTPTDEQQYEISLLYKPDKSVIKTKKWNNMVSYKNPKNRYSTKENIFQLWDIELCKNDWSKNLSKFSLAFPQDFCKKLSAGPPTQFRWVAWKTALQTYRFFVAGLYENLKTQKELCKFIGTIKNDVSRTFINAFYDRNALENILCAYAEYNKKVGYCQGMSFIAGLLLIVSDNNEEETFWALVSLMEHKIFTDKLDLSGINKIYVTNFPMVRIFEILFDNFLRQQNPNIYSYFEKIGLPTSLWLHSWILSLFTYKFPVDFCIRLWDALFSYGISHLIVILYQIIETLYENECFDNKNMEECYNILKMSDSTYFEYRKYLDVNQIIKKSQRIHIDYENYNKIIREAKMQINNNGNPQSDQIVFDEEKQNESLLLIPIKKSKNYNPNIDNSEISPLTNKNNEIKLPPISKNKSHCFVFDYEPVKNIQSQLLEKTQKSAIRKVKLKKSVKNMSAVKQKRERKQSESILINVFGKSEKKIEEREGLKNEKLKFKENINIRKRPLSNCSIQRKIN